MTIEKFTDVLVRVIADNAVVAVSDPTVPA